MELCFGILTVLALIFFVKKSMGCCAKCLGLRKYNQLYLTRPFKRKMISILRKTKSEPILSLTDGDLNRNSPLRKTLPVRFTLPDPDPIPEEPEEITPAPLVGIKLTPSLESPTPSSST